MKLIDKVAVVAEIERRVNALYPKNGQGIVVTEILKEHYKDLKDFIDTLEVKEVDLDKEIDDWYNTMGIPFSTEALKETARYFFGLGLKAQKGE